MRIETIDTVAAFRALRSEWNELLDRSLSTSPFLTHEWVDAWWDEYASKHDSMWIHCYRDDSTNRLVGILPLYVQGSMSWRSGRRLRFLCDALGATVLDCIVDPALELRTHEAMVTQLLSGTGDWDVLDLRRMPADSRFMSLLNRRCEEAGRRVRRGVSHSCVAITLPADWESYLHSLSRRERGRVRRLRRDLATFGALELEQVVGSAELDGALADSLDLFEEGMRRKYDRPFALPDRYRRFLLATSRALLDRGRLRLTTLRLDGCRVAFVWQVRHGDTMTAFQTGYDSKWGAQHVGFVIFGHAIEAAINEGCAVYNFGVGVSPYKMRFGGGVADYCGIRVYSRTFRGIVAATGDRIGTWARSAAKTMSPPALRAALERANELSGLGRL